MRLILASSRGSVGFVYLERVLNTRMPQTGGFSEMELCSLHLRGC